MSAAVATGIIGAAATIVVALIGVLGVRSQVRATREATITNRDAADRASVLAAWEKLVTPLQSRIDQQNARISEQEKRIKQIDAELTSHRLWRSRATAYIHALRDALGRAGQQVPDVPVGLDIDLD